MKSKEAIFFEGDLEMALVRYYVQREEDFIEELEAYNSKWRSIEEFGVLLTISFLIIASGTTGAIYLTVGVTALVAAVAIGIPCWKIKGYDRDKDPVFRGIIEKERVIDKLSQLNQEEYDVLKEIVNKLKENTRRKSTEFKGLIKKAYENYEGLREISFVERTYHELNCRKWENNP